MAAIKHKLHPILCEQCGSPAMKRLHARFCSYSCSAKWRHAHGGTNPASGPDHYKWKENLTDYGSLHVRVFAARGKASGCAQRPDKQCVSVKYEWAHLHDTDPRDPYNYVALCKSCHITYDNQRGSGNTRSKLTDEQVAELRHLYANGGRSQQSLADEFGVHQTTVSKVVREASYKAA